MIKKALRTLGIPGILALVCLCALPGFASSAQEARDQEIFELQGSFVPGALLIGRTTPENRVRHDGVAVRVSETGHFLLGLGRNAGGTTTVAVIRPDGSRTGRDFIIASRDYDIQRIDGLPANQVSPDPATQARIAAEGALIKKARKRDTPEPQFLSGFMWPAEGRISSVYGSQRILNGNPRSPHKGVDIAAPAGTVVRAMADGTVSLVHQDMFYTGKTVILDHGHGLASVYIHMSDILVTDGADVTRGQPIGKVGATGRATGPHLHWGVTLFAKHLDPVLVAGPMPATQ